MTAVLVFILQNNRFNVKTPISLDSAILIETPCCVPEPTLNQQQQLKVASAQWNHTHQIRDVLYTK